MFSKRNFFISTPELAVMTVSYEIMSQNESTFNLGYLGNDNESICSELNKQLTEDACLHGARMMIDALLALLTGRPGSKPLVDFLRTRVKIQYELNRDEGKRVLSKLTADLEFDAFKQNQLLRANVTSQVFDRIMLTCQMSRCDIADILCEESFGWSTKRSFIQSLIDMDDVVTIKMLSAYLQKDAFARISAKYPFCSRVVFVQ